ncbi:HCNGP-like protein-domain-containing protein [Microdochium trichocladiopsis]|uniref:HCNGP-like protein-domain-containing protein n=1 Tax=Microdochium trichocladiopsis TaxID=1682393 RepID=A0A9P8YDH4_9PEZI|nr:HCNGP-like protein-domain-containing protein [Microdochium trichocladiopsis]KAH7034872.1 HCNGP-like protein-domain-containing protein [Microdochium trichocladiopsis]
MALVGYGSSDDEDDELQPQQPQEQPVSKTDEGVSLGDAKSTSSGATASSQPAQHEPQQQQQQSQSLQQDVATTAPIATTPEAAVPLQPAPIGPQLGPSAAPGPQDSSVSTASFPPLEGAEDDQGPSPPSLPPPQAPGSPYTSHRATLRSLTLPTVPDMDIPASPPGSPTAEERQLSSKFEHFLDLKKKQGVHFNSRIGTSAAMRNPALTDKLLGFVDVDHKAQYANTLPQTVWDPAAFPRSSYKEQLRQSQADVAASRARGKGAPVAFVPSSSSSAGGAQSASGTQDKRKTRFDA